MPYHRTLTMENTIYPSKMPPCSRLSARPMVTHTPAPEQAAKTLSKERSRPGRGRKKKHKLGTLILDFPHGTPSENLSPPGDPRTVYLRHNNGIYP